MPGHENRGEYVSATCAVPVPRPPTEFQGGRGGWPAREHAGQSENRTNDNNEEPEEEDTEESHDRRL